MGIDYWQDFIVNFIYILGSILPGLVNQYIKCIHTVWYLISVYSGADLFPVPNGTLV